MKETTAQQILLLLKVIAADKPPAWSRPIKAYKNFDWAKIGATITDTDSHGATKVVWCGHIYTRRSGDNRKFGAAIWFSRSNGKGEADEATYARLITFKDSAQAEPLPDFVAKAIQN
jgi:DdrB-like protein